MRLHKLAHLDKSRPCARVKVVTKKQFNSVVEALLAAPPQRTFITEYKDEANIRAVTFEQFIDLARLCAEELRAQGVQVGDRVILILPQGITLMGAFAGAMLLGAVPAILAYPNFKVDPEKYTSGLVGVLQNLNARLVAVDEGFPTELQNLVEQASGASVVRPAHSAKDGRSTLLADAFWQPEQLAFIQHSAGTTGLQKGVALSHGSVLTQLEHLATVLDIDDRDRIYSWLPLYHDMGLIASFMLPLVYHLPIVIQSPIDWVVRPGSMLQLISDYRCTLTWVPNFALQLLARRVRDEDRVRYNLSSLRALINCSEPVRAESMDEFLTAYQPCGLRPNVLKSSYAMAENVFAVTQSEIKGSPRRLWVDERQLPRRSLAVPVANQAKGGVCVVSSGPCLPGNHVRIVSANGNVLGDGEVGEIFVQSDSMFSGYYNRPDLTAKAFTDGWYGSGDLGFCMDGELYVLGRKKDLIIVAGRNIYPQDIEEIVSRHPAIHDGRAVAFGLYNPELGTEDIIVVAEFNSVEIERDLRNAIIAELDVAPRAIYLVPAPWIVKSTAGKPARSTTREKLLIEHPEVVGNVHGEDPKVGRFGDGERKRVHNLPVSPATRVPAYEFFFDLVSDVVMARNIDGTIRFWNRRAEELYGWRKEEAIGKVSHSLLQTQFPKSLEEIDSELVQNGLWEGKLVHTTRDGGRIEVESRWALDLKQKSAAVIEINRRSSDV
jgi:PAS domain S-box-containing protein